MAQIVRHFRKIPVTIDAMQLTDESSVMDIVNWINDPNIGYQTSPPTIWINTLEGTMEANSGDWIIRGVEGEFYPCKPEIFNKTYQDV